MKVQNIFIFLLRANRKNRKKNFLRFLESTVEIYVRIEDSPCFFFVISLEYMKLYARKVLMASIELVWILFDPQKFRDLFILAEIGTWWVSNEKGNSSQILKISPTFRRRLDSTRKFISRRLLIKQSSASILLIRNTRIPYWKLSKGTKKNRRNGWVID